MTRRLYIEGVLADLDPAAIIALTLQFYSPLNLDFVKASHSNEFKLPLTVVNQVILGLAGSIKSTSQVLKDKLAIRYVQNGVEIIPNGVMAVNSVDSTHAACVLYSAFRDIYTLLNNRSLNDLDYTDLNQAFEHGDFYDLRLEAEVAGGGGEIFSAIVNLGENIVLNGNVEYIDNYVIIPPAPNSFLPILFGYKQVLQRMITQAGFKYDWGKLFDGVYDNPKFNSLAIMQAGYAGQYRFQYSDAFKQAVEFSALVDADETFTNIGAGAERRLFFKNTTKESDFYLPDAPGAARSRYVVTNADTALGYFSGTFRFQGFISRSGSACEVSIYVNGVAATGTGTMALAVGLNDVNIYIDPTTYYLGFKDGDIIEVGVHQTGANPCAMTYNAGDIFNFTLMGAGLSYVYLNQILPSLNQLAVFKDFLFRFGQIPKEKNRELTFKSLKDILSDVTGMINWTTKRDKKQGSYEIHLTQAQRNFFKYVSSDSFVDDGYGQGYYNLDDSNLKALTEFRSIFSSSLDTIIYGIHTANIPRQTGFVDGFPQFTSSTGARLLLTRMNEPVEPPIVMDLFPNNTPQTSYVVAAFSKVDAIAYERSLSYQNVLKEWYTSDGIMSTGFLQRLNNAKLVTRFYYLTDGDIQNFDTHKMIFDDGDYLIFPTIKNFVPGKVTEVELLKL